MHRRVKRFGFRFLAKKTALVYGRRTIFYLLNSRSLLLEAKVDVGRIKEFGFEARLVVHRQNRQRFVHG